MSKHGIPPPEHQVVLLSSDRTVALWVGGAHEQLVSAVASANQERVFQVYTKALVYTRQKSLNTRWRPISSAFTSANQGRVFQVYTKEYTSMYQTNYEKYLIFITC